MKVDHVAEIARLIGLISAESQHVGGGSDGSAALHELKSFVQKHPEAQATLEDQVNVRNLHVYWGVMSHSIVVR